MFYCEVLSVVSNFPIITLGKKELVGLHVLHFDVLWLFVFCVSSLWCRGLVCSMIVAFPGHTRLQMSRSKKEKKGLSDINSQETVIEFVKISKIKNLPAQAVIWRKNAYKHLTSI